MKTLLDELTSVLPSGLHIPEPLVQLYEWMESNRLVEPGEGGYLVGQLYPSEKMIEGWTDEERPGGTAIEFTAGIDLSGWFGLGQIGELDNICVFARTGADGSMAALWLDENNNQKIVHLGSGSGSTMICILAENAIDFIRLLAIGYDEICWGENFSEPPNAMCTEGDLFVFPNVIFQRWVVETFSTTIPKAANEIVTNVARMEDEDSNDAFFRWVKSKRRMG